VKLKLVFTTVSLNRFQAFSRRVSKPGETSARGGVPQPARQEHAQLGPQQAGRVRGEPEEVEGVPGAVRAGGRFFVTSGNFFKQVFVIEILGATLE
jgi:hypothetical protein